MIDIETIEVDLSGRCAHTCSYCIYRDATYKIHNRNFSSSNEFSRQGARFLAGQIISAGIKRVVLSCLGDAGFYPYLEDFASAIGDIPVSVQTNGLFFTPKKFEMLRNPERICFRLDAVSDQVYSKIHRVNSRQFYTVVRNFVCVRKAIEEAKNGCCAEIFFTIVPENIEQIWLAAQFYKDLGASRIIYNLLPLPIFTEQQKGRIKEEIEKAIQFYGSSFCVKAESWCGQDAQGCNDPNIVIGNDTNLYLCQTLRYLRFAVIGSVIEESLPVLLGKAKARRDPWFCRPRKFIQLSIL